MTDSIVEIQGKNLKLSNLEKVLYPAAGFTKKDVIDYYVRIAPAILPHLSGRALTRKRYPDGVDGEPFFEKNAPMHKPDWVKTAPIWSEGNRRTVHYVLANDLATLVWLANLAALELHPSLALAKDIKCPTEMVFDLDPGPPANIVQCCQVAIWLREIFDHFGLQSFPKTSGSKGMQIYVPLNTPTTFHATKDFSRALAQLLEQEHRDLVVSDMKKHLRTGKVFVDWSQNDEHKTTIWVYSLRARERPTASTPITWEEVERTHKKKDAALLVFEASKTVARFEKMGDLFEPLLELKQKLPDLKATEVAGAADSSRSRLRRRPAGNKCGAGRGPRSPPEAGVPEKEQKGITAAESYPGSHNRRIMPQFYAGTSGWAYPTWKPDFYPDKLAQKKFLGPLCDQFNTVEVNFTFRQLVKETTIQNWLNDTPAHFRFWGQGTPGHHAHQAAEGRLKTSCRGS